MGSSYFQRHFFPARLALALELRTNSIKPKLSQQVGSELRGQNQQWKFEAGGIKNARSVLSLKNCITSGGGWSR